jgi:hypothetical protein
MLFKTSVFIQPSSHGMSIFDGNYFYTCCFSFHHLLKGQCRESINCPSRVTMRQNSMGAGDPP